MVNKQVKTDEKTQNIGVYIGASEKAISETRAAINDILKSQAEQSTKVVALETLRSLCSVNNTSISGCNITT